MYNVFMMKRDFWVSLFVLPITIFLLCTAVTSVALKKIIKGNLIIYNLFSG